MADDYLKRLLPTWMRAVALEPGGDRIAAIKRSAVKFGETLSDRDILDMVLLAYKQSHGNAFDVLGDSIREYDSTFGCLADDLESSIAASAAVSALLMQESISASIAAQGVLSAEWVGLKPSVAELPELALNTSRRRSEALRKRRDLPSPVIEASDEYVSDGETDDDIDQMEDREYTEHMAKKIQHRQYLYASVLADRLDAADEELELLWWAFSGYSELAKKKWASLPPESAALLCGIELGGKLAFEIEQPSTETLLARLLGPDTEKLVSLPEAVEATAAFLDSVGLTNGHPLLPILSSVSEYRALSGATSWRDSVSSRWSIVPDRSTEKLAFACQAARERALMGNVSHG